MLIMLIWSYAIIFCSESVRPIDKILEYALTQKNETLAILALDAGADPNMPIEKTGGFNQPSFIAFPLIKAAEENLEDLVYKLVACGAQVNAQADHGTTALHAVLYTMGFEFSLHEFERVKKRRRIIQALLNAGADPLLKNNAGMSPFLYAIRRDDMVVVQMFLKALDSGVIPKETSTTIDHAKSDEMRDLLRKSLS